MSSLSEGKIRSHGFSKIRNHGSPSEVKVRSHSLSKFRSEVMVYSSRVRIRTHRQSGFFVHCMIQIYCNLVANFYMPHQNGVDLENTCIYAVFSDLK